MNITGDKNIIPSPGKSGRTVFCLGETLLDIIIKKDMSIIAKPGGSMLNAAVSLGRAGMHVQLVSELFRDEPGRMILQFLADSHVRVDSPDYSGEGKTPLALAFLDENSDAEYSFYKNYPEKRVIQSFPDTGDEDILLFGSIYSVTPGIRNSVQQLLKNAKRNHTFVIYDPNIRKSFSGQMSNLVPRIRENFSFSDIVRGSNEDFLSIFATDDPDLIFDEVRRAGCRILVLTRSGEDVLVYSGDSRFSFPVPRIHPVSTIGAGDSFNAGLIYGILSRNIRRHDLERMKEDQWHSLIDVGIRFAQVVCLSDENYIPENIIQTIK
jgi:fructokinase